MVLDQANAQAGTVGWDASFDGDSAPVASAAEFHDQVSVTYSRGDQQILDLVSPYLAAVTEALAPLLAAEGLSLTEATIEDLLANDGLADLVIGAATIAVAQVDAIGLHPMEVGSHQVAADLASAPAMFEQVDLEVDHPQFVAHGSAQASLRSDLPAGWQLHVDPGPRHLMFDENGDPCYPDIPPFEEFWPKCPEPDPPTDVVDVPCLEDDRFVRAEARLRELRNFSRVPSSFRGFDYRDELEQSVERPIDELYRCGSNPSSASTMASWYGPPGPAVIRLYDSFLDLDLTWDLLSAISGPIDFRAAILLHEHVHRIEDPQQGTVSAPFDRDYQPAGSAGQDDCPLSGTEYDAAYLQALYLGGSEAVARMAADIYGRKQCGQLSSSARLLAAAGDIIEALALGWLASLDVIATLTVLLTGEGVMDLLSQLFPSNVAAVVLLGLPG